MNIQENKSLKGLLCCAGLEGDGNCTRCPYNAIEDGAECIKAMCRDVVKHIETMQQKEVALKSQCKELQSEIEKLNKKLNNKTNN